MGEIFENVQLSQIDTNNAILENGRDFFLFHAPSLKIFKIDKKLCNLLISLSTEHNNIYNGIKKSEFGHLYIDDLSKCGIFKSDSPNIISSATHAHYDDPLYFKVLTLNLSHKCNLDCSYCYAGKVEYQSKSKSHFMSCEVAIEAIDYFLKNIKSDNSEKYIDFSGGEPLLNPNALKKAVLYLSKKLKRTNHRIALGIITNGILLSKDMFDFLQRHNVNITISIDGDEEFHDANRVSTSGEGSYQKVVANIKKLIPKRPDLFSARATVTPNNMDIKRIFAHLEELGFCEYSFDIAFGDFEDSSLNWNEDSIIEYDKHYGLYINDLINRLLIGQRPGLIYIPERLNRIYKRMYRSSPCRMSKHLLVVTPNGDYYPCYRLTEIEGFKIGSIESGIDQKCRKELFPKLVFEKEKCRTCWARYLCGGGCPAVSFLENGDDRYPDEWICKSRIISWKWFLWFFIKLKERNYRFESLY